jgi:hypothetical protein
MSPLYRFNENRNSPRCVFFERAELNQLLSLYSCNVASGEWRDYAIDQVGGAAIFSVFRHTYAAPLFSIAKQRNNRSIEYVVFAGHEKLKRAKTLGDVLEVFRKKIRVVS